MFKCQLCKDKFTEPEDLYEHLEEEHEEMIPKNFTPAQYYYYLKTGKEHGKCVVCTMPTKWNDSTNKYARFCEMESCKEKYKEEFKKRMIGKYGRVHLLNDPDQQRKMLANRSISGKYEWSDNREVAYTGTYELDFLKFLDVFMHFDSKDIMAPSPHTYYYMYEGEEKFYIPDFFIPSLNLEIEIKDGGTNPNTHHKIQDVDKVKEKLKDSVMTSQKQFSYIKITDKNYDSFFDFMMRKKKEFEKDGKIDEAIFILNESVMVPVTEAVGEITLVQLKSQNDKFKHPLKDVLQTSEEDVDLSNTGVEPGKNIAKEFNREELLLAYYKQISHPNASQDELKFVLEIMDAEYKGMQNKTTGMNVPLAEGIRQLRKEIEARITE